MQKELHFLNGDALNAQFPKDILGKRLICRECLVEGPVGETELVNFYSARAAYLDKHYGESKLEVYRAKVISQFEQLKEAAEGGHCINLWFEDDLFCQVNLWFTLSLLHQVNNQSEIYLVRPIKHTPFGFGGLNTSELIHCYNGRVPITEFSTWKALWEAYRLGELEQLTEVARSFEQHYSFVTRAVAAHLARFPNLTQEGRPKERLKAIIREIGTTQFGPVFQVFCRTEAIYGFGDVYVKRLFDEVIASMNKEG